MDDFDNDYVATLLKNEATTRLSSYSTQGLDAILPSRAKDSAPKLNTRFLKNIVRNVDSHNAALRARDAAETRLRFRSLRSDSHSDPPEVNNSWSRNGEKSRKRRRRSCPRSRQRSRSPVSEGRPRYRHRSHSREDRHHRHKHRSEKRHYRRECDERDSSRRSRQSRQHATDEGDGRHRRKKERSDRSRSAQGDIDQPQHGRRKGSRHSRENSPTPSHPSVSSDPLDDLVGPPPPAVSRARGRGNCGKSSIDEHFRDNYDPAADGRPNSDDEVEWDNAVEVFRDRLKWEQQGAERLRSAGFDEQFVTAWENNTLCHEANLKWAKKGVTREWDRGKVIDDGTGETELRVAWAKKA